MTGPYDGYRDLQYLTGTLNTGSNSFVETTLTLSNVAALIKRIAITAAANSGFSLYKDSSAAATNLLDGEFVNAAIAAWGVGGEGLWVPKSSTLVVRFFNQPTNQDCTYNLLAAIK